MRRLSDHGVHRDRTMRCLNAGVTVVTANYCVHRVENGDMDNRHRTARASRSKLFSEDSILARRNWRMVEATSIESDFIPAMKRVEAFFRAIRVTALPGLKCRPKVD